MKTSTSSSINMEHNGHTRHRGRGRGRHHWRDEDEHNTSRSHGLPLMVVDPPGHSRYQKSRNSGDINDKSRPKGKPSDVHFHTHESHRQRSRSITPGTSGRHTTNRTKKHPPRERSKIEHAVEKYAMERHAAEKAISTAVGAAYRIRNDQGLWLGKKGFKVATVATASATMDVLLDHDPKKHPLAHIAVTAIQKAVLNRIMNVK